MKIVADENIIYAGEAFSALGNVTLVPGREITRDILQGADILLVRSVTGVNENLLRNTGIGFVGTATIGRDHVDTGYLESAGISFADAAGSNADAVAEYVFTALLEIFAEREYDLSGKSIGVIGVGNIGSRVAKIATSLGMKVLKNDPPLKRLTSREDYLELDDLMECDIITLHVPLNMEGPDKTFHMFDNKRLKKLKDGVVLINASRGHIVDNEALQSIIGEKNFSAVIDVWENEPFVSTGLLEKTIIATPHVAGYSYEGKVNGTKMIYNSLCNFLGKVPAWQPATPPVGNNHLSLDALSGMAGLRKLFSGIYDIRKDDKQFRTVLNMPSKEGAIYFDGLRKNYLLRREFSNFSVALKNRNDETENFLKSIRFRATRE